MRQDPFMVVGMVRSGTSYVGSILAANGVDMGARLKPADAHNRNGYFEDLGHSRCRSGGSSDGMTLATRGSFPVETTVDEDGELAAYIERRRFAGRWGVKAPGILLFWPLWARLLPPETVVLLPFRHPFAVLDSFLRWGMEVEAILGLWLS
jgi:hypothetical protein